MTKEVSLIESARLFAAKKHAEVNQVRKYTGEPYIVHPEAVAGIVETVPHTDEMIAAAWLHDTVEDTNTTLEEVEGLFGHEVATLVEMLTDVSKKSDGNRSVRKEIDRKHTAKASPAAKTVKLADLIHNSESIMAADPDFAKIYTKEKLLLLDVLKEGDSTLWHKAKSIVDDALIEMGVSVGATS
jgi:(p)ppGpp synthase/HD superfamily hydrolase